MEDLKGIFLIKIIKADLYRDTEFLGKMAPYVSIENESSAQKLRTTAKRGGGKTPEWQEVVSMEVKLGDQIKLQVVDKDKITKDDLVGETTLVCMKEHVNMKSLLWLDLNFEGKKSGKLQIDVEFLPNTESMKCIKAMLEKYLQERTETLGKYQKGEVVEVVKKVDNKEETQKEIADKGKALEEEKRLKEEKHEEKVKQINKQVDDNNAKSLVLQTDLDNLKKSLSRYGITKILIS